MRRCDDVRRVHSDILIGGFTLLAVSAGSCAEPRADVLRVEEVPVLSVEEASRIGSIEDSDLGLAQIADVSADADAELVYVLEQSVPEVRVYTWNGRLVRRIGRGGAGPGEFRTPVALGLVADTLWVRDPGLRRITFYTQEGEPIRSVPMTSVPVEVSDPNVRASVVPGVPHEDGWIEGVADVFFTGPIAVDSVALPRVRFDGDGDVLDTVGFSSVPAGANQLLIDGVPVVLPDLHGVGTTWLEGSHDRLVVDEGRQAGAEEATFRVVLLSADEDTAFVRTFGYQPRVIGQAFADSTARDAVAQYVVLGMDTAAARRRMSEVLRARSFHPPAIAFHQGHDGLLWLQIDDAEASRGRYFLFRKDGSVLGQVPLPPDATVQWSDTRSVWTVEPDAFQVPWLVRYGIGPAAQDG